ncbi:MobA/MobL family protein [Psychrobacter sp. P11G5]|uniref:MobA/MobL family protein n=1 Tax=Psychrobacter sp. P11G5 TaxID=1699624 RepID=UPI00082B482B|nr:MobA/MobL family protein [Psychrobacter sp. P11G5]
MAIFLASTKSISRGSGQSAVASASYRAGEKLEDERYGKTHDYSKRSGVMSADIILPSALADAGVTIDRSDLWNKAESAEKRKDARVAREWLVNLPHELSEQDRKDIAHRFAQELADRYDTIADCAIHKPTQREIERGADPRNFHAHIMFTTRKAVIGNNNEIVLTDKADIELSDTKRRQLGFEIERVNEELGEIRQLWEKITNEKLAEHKHDLIDCRSYADQGKDIEPQLKMGSVATKLERDAYEKAKQEALDNEQEFTGIAPVTIRGEINAMIAERNSLVLEASNKIIFERENSERINRTQRIVDENTDRASNTESIIDRISRTLGESTGRVKDTESIIERTQRVIDANADRVRDAKSANEWAAERCKNLPKATNGAIKAIERTLQRIDENAVRSKNTVSAINGTSEINDNRKQRAEQASSWIDHNSKRAANSKSEASRVNNSIAERAKPAPSPFDDEYERAFHERKRQIDQKTRDAARYASEAEQNTRRIKADTLDKKKVLAYRLLTRNHDSKRLRKGRNDKSEHYPEKFDYRQIAILNEFAHSLGIHTIEKEYLEKHELVVDMLSLEVMQNNLAAINILVDNQKERSHHQTVTADFYDFIDKVDKQRAEQVEQYQTRLGRNDTSRVTATIMTAQPYLVALTKYANNSEKTDENRALAEQHINRTIRLTVKQYEVAYKGLDTLMNHDSVQKHVRELGDSLGRFTTDYAEKISGDDLRSINNGLKVLDREIDTSNVNDNRDNPSLGF